jgi:hypothetical protein
MSHNISNIRFGIEICNNRVDNEHIRYANCSKCGLIFYENGVDNFIVSACNERELYNLSCDEIILRNVLK